jgi:arylsulfatase A-like enzyme
MPIQPEMRLAVIAAMGAVLLCASASGCSERRDVAGANVLLIVADTLRADHLGAYGYDVPTSPFLDELAETSVLIEDATSPSSHTVPSVLSMLTSLYPVRHRNQYFPRTDSFRVAQARVRPQVGDALATVAERFRDAGYRTGAIMTNPWLRSDYGFSRGFDEWHDLHGPRWSNHPRGADVNEAAISFLNRWRKDGGGRFFLYVHYMDVHLPYQTSARHLDAFIGGQTGRLLRSYGPAPDAEAADVAFSRALYDAAIRTLDDHLRHLLSVVRARRLDRSTLIVFTADHGEEFHEHGGMGHGWTLYQEVVHVPLLFRHPALSPRRVSAPVSGVDLVPTLLDLAGLEVPAGLDGVSLAPWIRGEAREPPMERFIRSELGVATSIRQGDRKVIRAGSDGGRTEAYDLAGDRSESRPVEAGPPWRALVQELDRPVEPVADDDVSPAPEEPDFERRLRALGYAQ